MSLPHSNPTERIPPAVRLSLETLVGSDLESNQVMHWYPPMWEQHLAHAHETTIGQQAQPYSVPDTWALSPEGPDAHILYGCPRCGVTLKQAKDYIRHAKQTCYALEIFRCPDCPKTFTRKHRFTKHHKTKHHGLCQASKCTHQDQALTTLPDKAALGCGFCGLLCKTGLHLYLRHLIVDHFRQGATLAEWSTDTQLLSLLSQFHIRHQWDDILSSPFPDGFSQPLLQWPLELAKEAISLLESAPSGDQLTRMLWRLRAALGAPQLDVEVQIGDAPFDALLSAFPNETPTFASHPVSPYRPESALSSSQTLQGTPADDKFDDFNANTHAYATDLDYDQSMMDPTFDEPVIYSPVTYHSNGPYSEPYYHWPSNNGFDTSSAHVPAEHGFVQDNVASSDYYLSSSPAPCIDDSAIFGGPSGQSALVLNPTPPLPPLDTTHRRRRSSRLSRAFSTILSPIMTSE